MAVARINPAADIVYGNSTVSVGTKTLTYDNAARSIHIPDETGVIEFENVDSRYRSAEWVFENTAEQAAATDTNSAGSGHDAVVYLASKNKRQHVLFGVAWSYDSAPASGGIVVESPSGTVVFSEDVTAAGPNSFPFPKGLKGSPGQDVLVRLKDGSVSKGVSLLGHRVE